MGSEKRWVGMVVEGIRSGHEEGESKGLEKGSKRDREGDREGDQKGFSEEKARNDNASSPTLLPATSTFHTYSV